MNLELIDVKWRPGFHIIGFALFKHTYSFKFIAKFGLVYGFKQESDLKHIKNYGTRMTYEEAAGFFPDLFEKEDYE